MAEAAVAAPTADPAAVTTPPAAPTAIGEVKAETPPAAPSGADPKSLIGGDKELGTPFDPTTFTYPEGLEVNDEAKTFLGDLAKKFNVSSDGMKSLLDYHAKEVKAVSDRVGATLDESWNSTLEGWKGEATKHYGTPEKLTAAIKASEAVIDEFGGDEVYEAFKTTGMGNHPAMIKMLEKVSKALGEGRPIPPGKSAQTTKSPGRYVPLNGQEGIT